MFQLWKFVLLCGLLTGTSAGIIENLGNSLSGIVNGLKPVLNNGLQDIESESIRVMICGTQSLFPKHYADAAFPGTATRGCPLWVIY